MSAHELTILLVFLGGFLLAMFAIDEYIERKRFKREIKDILDNYPSYYKDNKNHPTKK